MWIFNKIRIVGSLRCMVVFADNRHFCCERFWTKCCMQQLTSSSLTSSYFFHWLAAT